jgi:hypothetical protein
MHLYLGPLNRAEPLRRGLWSRVVPEELMEEHIDIGLSLPLAHAWPQTAKHLHA